MRVRLAAVVVAVMAAMAALLYVIYGLVNTRGEQDNIKILSSLNYESSDIPFRRGDILDRNGSCLATTEKVYDLEINCQQIMSDEERYLEPTVEALSVALELSAEDLRKKITESPNRQYMRYRRRISADAKERFENKKNDMNSSFSTQKSKKRVIGVNFRAGYKRVYPNGSLACGVLGFASGSMDGATGGIEQYYNDELTGTSGVSYGYLSDDYNLERVVKPAVDGQTIVSTIDINVQKTVEKAIEEWQNETGSDHIGCVVMDPRNGEVLAMASNRSFDLNDPASASDAYTEEELLEMGREFLPAKELQELLTDGDTDARENDTAEKAETAASGQEVSDAETAASGQGAPDAADKADEGEAEEAEETEEAEEAEETDEPADVVYDVDRLTPSQRARLLEAGKSAARNIQWRNYCISDTYEPGSPSKIFTVSAALEEGVINGTESYYCDGGQQVSDWYIKCVNKNGHGMLTVTESLMQSCNDVMMQLASAIGRERFVKNMGIFGFGQKTGIDLPAEEGAHTLGYFDAENMNPSDLATNSFGQNYNCTMIQMAAAYASVINGGSYYEPHVAKEILSPQNSLVKRMDPVLVRETVSEGTSEFIKNALYETVENGTGKAAAVEGYSIGGKTGTAEKQPRGTGNYLVSFCGFAPADDPQVLTYVIIDTPHVADQPHSTYASNVFSKIMEHILPYLNVYPEADARALAEREAAEEADDAAEKTAVEAEAAQTETLESEAGEDPAENAGQTDIYTDERAEGSGSVSADEEYIDTSDSLDTGIPGNTFGEEGT